MRRRDFISIVGSAAAWPLATRAQQPAMPVIGYLNSGSPDSDGPRLTGLRHGLNEAGYLEGRNLVIEYRWAGNQFDRLPALAVELVQIRVAVIVSLAFLRLSRPRLQPPPSQSCSASASIRFRSDLLQVSIGREATSRASTNSMASWGRRRSRCCTSWYPEPRRSAFWRTRTIRLFMS